MTKNNNKKQKTKKKIIKANKKQRAKRPSKNAFGPVAAINTAPVAIGNSVRGASAQVVTTANGVTIRGRDFAFPAIGTGSVQTWTLCGGTPLAPACFSDSTIRQYLQMYQRFRWRRLIAHYITSSPTTANGDVLFYHQKNRNSVFLSQTSSQFLPFVMSDDDTVMGPQWTNHSVDLHIQSNWKSTDYGMSANVDDFSEGELFLLSKTSTTDSPGYVIFDYEIQFADLQITPRLLVLPLPRAQWFQTSFIQSAQTADKTQVLWTIGGTNISGGSSAIPANAKYGDLYKCILDITNSSLTSTASTAVWSGSSNTPSNNVYALNDYNSTDLVLDIVDGTTIYLCYNGANFFPVANAETAFTEGGSKFLVNNPSNTTNLLVAFTLQCWVSLIGTVGVTNLNPNY